MKAEPSTDKKREALVDALHNDCSIRDHSLFKLEEEFKARPTRANRRLLRLVARALLTDAHAGNRMDAVETLGWVGTRSDCHGVIERLNDADWTVRAAAYSSLANIGNRANGSRILKGLEDSNPVVRRYAAVALSDLIGAEACELLRDAFVNEADDYARVGLASVFARWGDASARAELERFAANPNPHLHSSARETLAELSA